MQPIFINQKDNFTANFGDALRSSAIFYYRTGPGFRTTIAFMNYWKSKRNLEVAIVASLRTMAGKLVRRERLRFGDATVLNYSPSVDAATFEGSLEVESFCTENLVIPYSAIMAIYETTSGVTMVHSYARAYSRHEVEDGRCICVGEGSCWTLRDRPGVRSFGIFHNGPKQMPPQRIVLRVSGQSGRQQAELDLPALAPYQTVKVIPSEHLPHLASLLSGAPGQANLSFQLGEGFTRMLVGNEAVDGSDMQVTHSNFNYASHRTDVIEDPRACGYMYIPDAGISDKTVIIYPDTDSGRYEVTDGSTTTAFVTGEVVTLPCKGRCPALPANRRQAAEPHRDGDRGQRSGSCRAVRVLARGPHARSTPQAPLVGRVRRTTRPELDLDRARRPRDLRRHAGQRRDQGLAALLANDRRPRTGARCAGRRHAWRRHTVARAV